MRAVVLGRQDFHGYLTFLKSAQPVPKTVATYQFFEVDGQQVTVFDIDLYGVHILFDLERRRLYDAQAILNTRQLLNKTFLSRGS